jgi:DNA-binding transcriptional LysR family regulator
MELRHLIYFRKLAEELHFRKASERLHIAQPALSRQIKELESELQVTLFDRNRRKVALTAAGIHLHKQATFILTRLEETKLELKRIQNMELGTVRIGYVSTAMYSMLPAFLNRVKKQIPELQLSLREMTTYDQVQSVRNGTLEMGFARAPVNDANISQQIVCRESFSLILPAGHPLAGKKIKKNLSALNDEPFVFFPRHYNPGYYDKTISLCHQAGFTPRIQYEGVGSNTLLQMVASGLGITILPSSIAAVPDNRVVCIPLDFIPEKAVLAIIYDKDRLPGVLRELVLSAGKRKR